VADVPPAPDLGATSGSVPNSATDGAPEAATAPAATQIGPDGSGRVVLASSSPRRRALLRRLGLEPVVVPADVDETPGPMEAPAMLVRRLAVAKAMAVAARRPPDDVVVAGDTVVAQDGRILGKPADAAEAAVMLRSLSGRGHQAISGVAVARGGTTQPSDTRSDVSITMVSFREFGQRELDAYLASGEWQGKAGAYALQGLAGAFVTTMQGLDTTVIGLPLGPTVTLLRSVGVDPLAL